MPLYFAHAMTFGDMMRARSAFYSVQDGFAWFMDYYRQIMEWAASVERVYKFVEIAQAADSKVKFDAKFSGQNSNLDGANESAQVTAANLMQDKFDENTGANELRGKNLQIFTPSGERLVCGLNLSVKSGEWVLLRGASGTGKSSVFRYIAGIWDHGSGEVCLPRGTMSVPQKPFLARMSLRRLIAYPSDLQGSDADFEGILRRVRLEKFIRELDEVKDWGKILSGGEAQRLAFARVYFTRPALLLLDEATSALDPNTTNSILELLKQINQTLNISVVLVTHEMEVVKSIARRAVLLESGKIIGSGTIEELFLKPDEKMKEFLGEDEILPSEGVNIRLFFPKEVAQNSVITHMARTLNIDFNIVWGKLEKLNENVLGSLVINVDPKDEARVTEYIKQSGVLWEVA